MNKEPVYIYLISSQNKDLIADLRTKILKTEKGKPYLKKPEFGHISISHSGKYFAFAMGTSELGMDLQEHLPDSRRYMQIMNRFFHEEEIKYIMEGREEEVLTRFFKVWTAKESYVKYTGEGISDDFSQFSVFQLKDQFHFKYVDAAEGYTLCVCVKEDSEVRVKFID